MRQRQWLELILDYDVDLQYYPDKINVVSDALSRKPEIYMLEQLTKQNKLLREMVQLDLMVARRTGESG